MNILTPDNRRAALLRQELDWLRLDLAEAEDANERSALLDAIQDTERALFLTGSTREELT